MKTAGVIMILLAAGSAGFKISRSLKERCRLLRQMMAALEVLKNEVGFCGTPLPQAFALMAVSCDGPLESVFSSAARQMDHSRWLTPYAALENALRDEPCLQADEPIQTLLLELGTKLGKYDRDSQNCGIEQAREQTAMLFHQAEQERSVRSRTYQVLSICTGLALVILLV